MLLDALLERMPEWMHCWVRPAIMEAMVIHGMDDTPVLRGGQKLGQAGGSEAGSETAGLGARGLREGLGRALRAARRVREAAPDARPCRGQPAPRGPGAGARGGGAGWGGGGGGRRAYAMKVYTRTGDKGESSLYNGERRPKDFQVFEALGDTDELNSMLGAAREFALGVHGLEDLPEQLEEIQSRLLDVGSAVATPLATSSDAKVARTKFPEASVTALEHWIDEMDEELPPLKNFILPSGGKGPAFLHLARTVCRRAERKVVPLVREESVEPVVGRYLNRLSDCASPPGRGAGLGGGNAEGRRARD